MALVLRSGKVYCAPPSVPRSTRLPTKSQQTNKDANEKTHELAAMTTISKRIRECPICFEDMKTPIYQCRQGHVLCSTCLPKYAKKTCPTCKEVMPKSSIRNRVLEDICAVKRANSTGNDGQNASGDQDHDPKKPRMIEDDEHVGVTCDGPDCHDQTIVGIRYKCVECPDYDLCKKCIKKGVHDHHLFLRIPKPSQWTSAAKLLSKHKG